MNSGFVKDCATRLPVASGLLSAQHGMSSGCRWRSPSIYAGQIGYFE